MGPVGPMELLLILLVILIIFGAGRLSEIGEGLGKGIKGFKKAMQDEPPPALPPPQSKEKELPPGKDN